MTIRNLDFLLRPRSIAVVGASDREHTVGTAAMRNVLKSGFRGPVLPLHSKRRSVAGVHAYRDVAYLPEVPDLAVICTPPDSIPGLVHSLGVHGTRAVAILTDGVDHESVLAAAKPHLMRVLGPGSMGLLAPGLGINASFAPTPALPGSVAFVAQSGALLAAALDWAATRKVGFSLVVSLGDALDVDAADVLDYLANDPGTRAVLLYLESVPAGRKFLSAARATARTKPVIVMKSGRTPAGAEAATRHTGAHPGEDDAFNAAIARAGMLRVDTVAALFDAAETLTRMRPSRATKLVILANAGGPGVIAADAALMRGGELACAPIDLGADAMPQRYADVLQSALAESTDHAVLLIHGPSGMVAGEAVAEACATVAGDADRVLACWMGGERARDGAGALRRAGIPVYETPERAVEAFLQAVEYRRNQEALQEAPDSASADFAPDEGTAQSVLADALHAGREHLTDPEGKKLLAAYGIPVVHTHVAANADEAAGLAAGIGYPVALKVLSPDLDHRAEVGGVMLNLETEEELRAAAGDIARRMRQYRPDARFGGFTVQRMVRPPGAVHRRHGAHELTLRAAEDSSFGIVIRLAPGPLHCLDRPAVGIVPLNPALATDMLARSAVPRVLGGAASSNAVAVMLAHLSQLLVHHPEIMELVIDPLLADDKGVMALETRVRIAQPKHRRGGHLAIPPYPRELEQRVDLDGFSVLVRPVRPEDAREYARFIARTDAPDMRFRFFTRVRKLPAKDLARYTQIDYDREMAFVAVSSGTDAAAEILGEVRIMTYPDGESAEFVVLVRGDMKRRGLGRTLLGKAIDYSRASGIATLIGQILRENEAMIALARKCGMEVELPPESSLAIAHIDLRPSPAVVQLF